MSAVKTMKLKKKRERGKCLDTQFATRVQRTPGKKDGEKKKKKKKDEDYRLSQEKNEVPVANFYHETVATLILVNG